MGSSPLTRGKLALDRGLTAPKGLIPAHAGKTGARSGPHCAQRAHPRSRGENPGHSTKKAATRGSSPLTRGKHLATDTLPGDSGLIPAHAGKTAPRATLAFRARAHPRSRGENLQGLIICARSCGSSPLTRGKRYPVSVHRPLSRLIPAHAGKTRRRRHRGGYSGAHPRSRGENGRRGAPTGSPAGSSPLTRGKPGRVGVKRSSPGLIPAHAGKTSEMLVSISINPAHPRSRGENYQVPLFGTASRGSSPLTRGKLVGEAAPEDGSRLIPAHAGKTADCAAGRSGGRAHPRSRGENP